MNRYRLLSWWSVIGGVLVAIIGVLHTTATPMVYKVALTKIPDKAAGITYFFGVMGLYVIFSGWLMVYSARGLGRSERWAWMIALTNAACNVLAGAGAVIAGFRHSLVLIWIFVSLSISVLSCFFYRDYRRTA